VFVAISIGALDIQLDQQILHSFRSRLIELIGCLNGLPCPFASYDFK
jgi:hypothetical protein